MIRSGDTYWESLCRADRDNALLVIPWMSCNEVTANWDTHNYSENWRETTLGTVHASRYCVAMTVPRSQLVNPNFTPYYHCVSRCVRRAFLCGKDAVTGYNFEHRRSWIEGRLLELAGLFALDVCAYAVMSNHYHLVLHINTAKLQAWSSEDILSRWQRPANWDTHNYSENWRETTLGTVHASRYCVAMTVPRSQLVNPNFTPYYHCVSRCVRRAFLCGKDAVTGYNFEHRRSWIEGRLLELAGLFALDVCAYAVMSNHYHLVLHINTAKLQAWSSEDILSRWQRLHRLPEGFDNFDDEEIARLISVWRERLGSISWFMKCLNEPLARLANREDDCKGRFWEGRFKSQALLDEASLLKCMAYVDLNPVRAEMAVTPEDSAHTSIQARIDNRDEELAPMADEGVTGFALPVRKMEYLNLVDWTGRQYRQNKRGRIDAATPPIVKRLQRSSLRPWVDEMSHLTRHYYRAIGTAVALNVYREQLGQRRLNGLTA